MTASLHDPLALGLLRLSRWLWRALLCGLWAAAPGAQAAAPPTCPAPCQIDLAGTWRFLPGNLTGALQFDPPQRKPDAQWRDIRVPANWHLDGIDHSGVAWYRREFDAPATVAPTRAVLQFGGIDYFADVWLNGRYLGAHEGYFEAFSFDATHALRPGQRNELVVRVDSPVEHPSACSRASSRTTTPAPAAPGPPAGRSATPAASGAMSPCASGRHWCSTNPRCAAAWTRRPAPRRPP